jgi:Ala-tRNA(Pro) deacylase
MTVYSRSPRDGWLVTTDAEESYARLIATLDEHRASYRLIDHPREGRTELVSELRGNALSAAAKCMVVMVKVGRKERAYVLAVVPGDRRVDLSRVKALLGGRYAGIADARTAEEMTGCVVGTVLPFTWNAALELVVDPGIFEQPELFFNAARLDRSIALASSDYRRIANAREVPIAEKVSADSFAEAVVAPEKQSKASGEK